MAPACVVPRNLGPVRCLRLNLAHAHARVMEFALTVQESLNRNTTQRYLEPSSDAKRELVDLI